MAGAVNGQGDPDTPDKGDLNQAGRRFEKHGHRNGGGAEKNQDQRAQEFTEAGSGGGSDGSFAAALGVPTLDGLGATGDGAHALHEHVEISSLPERSALLASMLLSLDQEEL